MKVDVLHIAKLANLSLKKNEEDKYEAQLTEILDYIKKLQEADTTNVAETSQTTGLENIVRVDTTSPSLSQDEALANTKQKHNGFLRVKAIFDNET